MSWLLIIGQTVPAAPVVDAASGVDARFLVAIMSRVLHILSALILGGGLFYIRAILAPAGPEGCFSSRRALWARWVGLATLLLIASGLYNYMQVITASKAPGAGALPPSYHMLFGIKFLLGLFVMFVAAILAGKTAAADRFRANMSWWLNWAWTAVLAIVVIGALLRSMH